jgi:hypothetical protein
MVTRFRSRHDRVHSSRHVSVLHRGVRLLGGCSDVPDSARTGRDPRGTRRVGLRPRHATMPGPRSTQSDGVSVLRTARDNQTYLARAILFRLLILSREQQVIACLVTTGLAREGVSGTRAAPGLVRRQLAGCCRELLAGRLPPSVDVRVSRRVASGSTKSTVAVALVGLETEHREQLVSSGLRDRVRRVAGCRGTRPCSSWGCGVLDGAGRCCPPPGRGRGRFCSAVAFGRSGSAGRPPRARRPSPPAMPRDHLPFGLGIRRRSNPAAAGRHPDAGAGAGGRAADLILCSHFAPTVSDTTRRARYQKSGNEPLSCVNAGGRYWDRTSDLFRVKEARSRCANRPRYHCRGGDGI